MTMQAMRAEFIKTILTNARAHIEAALAGELDITAGNEDNDVFTIASEDGGELTVNLKTGEVALTPDEE